MISFFSFLNPPLQLRKQNPKIRPSFYYFFYVGVFCIGDVEVWFAFFSLRKKKTRFFFVSIRDSSHAFDGLSIASYKSNSVAVVLLLHKTTGED